MPRLTGLPITSDLIEHWRSARRACVAGYISTAELPEFALPESAARLQQLLAKPKPRGQQGNKKPSMEHYLMHSYAFVLFQRIAANAVVSRLSRSAAPAPPSSFAAGAVNSSPTTAVSYASASPASPAPSSSSKVMRSSPAISPVGPAVAGADAATARFPHRPSSPSVAAAARGRGRSNSPASSRPLSPARKPPLPASATVKPPKSLQLPDATWLFNTHEHGPFSSSTRVVDACRTVGSQRPYGSACAVLSMIEFQLGSINDDHLARAALLCDEVLRAALSPSRLLCGHKP